jgi:hypothetical protein
LTYITPPTAIGGVLDSYEHTFVVGNKLFVVDQNGDECGLMPSDTVKYTPPPPANDAIAVDVAVTWSKDNQDCKSGRTVTVSLQDLQEMHNNMLATINQGADRIRAEQAQGKLPASPFQANGNATSQAFLSNAPPSDNNVQSELNVQALQAGRAETTTLQP